jgi:Fe2+ transport system protein FeoA
MTVRAVVPIEMMQAGQCGHVVDIGGEIALVHRLEEMGLRSGVSVRVLRGGQPCIVRVGGRRLSLRGDGSLRVLVEIDADG